MILGGIFKNSKTQFQTDSLLETSMYQYTIIMFLVEQ